MRYLLVLIGLLLWSVSASATDITTCQTISVAGSYTLQADVTSNATCFNVTSANTTLDLNGHTVTYDNAAPIAVTNSSFESSDLSNWTLSAGSTATRTSGSYIARTLYTGGYALSLSMPASDQTITSTEVYTLPASTKYTGSVMVYEPYNMSLAGNTTLQVSLDIIDSVTGTVYASGNVREQQASFTTRGFLYLKTAVYNVPVGGATVKLRMNVTGASTLVTGSGMPPYGAIIFDDVKIQQTNSYGVWFGDAARAGTSTVTSGIGTKGKIVQGQAAGDYSSGVRMSNVSLASVSTVVVNNLEITTSGTGSLPIWVSQASNLTISNNLVHYLANTVRVRDHYYDGTAIYADRTDTPPAGSVGGKIFNNTITNGIQSGIFAGSPNKTTAFTEIYGNDITLQSKYTNDFAIVGGYGPVSSNIHDNTVHCDPTANSGNNTCRGIFIHGDGGIIASNVIETHYNANNAEYGGCGSNVAAYGIQVDDGATNSTVTGNTVTSYADQCRGSAFRHYDVSGASTGNVVTGNTFIGIATGTALEVSAAVHIMENYASTLSFSGNTLKSNSTLVLFDGNAIQGSTRSFTMSGNSMQLTTPHSNKFFPLYDQSYANCSLHVPKSVSLLNNTYLDSDTRTTMSTATFFNYYSGAADVCTDITTPGSLTITEYTGGGDVTAPTTTASYPAGTYNAALSVGLTCSDDSGSCASTYYCLGVGCTDWNSYSGPISVATSNTLRFYSRDSIPNTETTKSVAYVIDTTLPVISAFTVISGTKQHIVPVTLSATDNVAIASYCLQESSDSSTCAWLASITGYVPKASGSTTLYGFAMDSAGNISNASTGVVVTFTPGKCQ